MRCRCRALLTFFHVWFFSRTPPRVCAVLRDGDKPVWISVCCSSCYCCPHPPYSHRTALIHITNNYLLPPLLPPVYPYLLTPPSALSADAKTQRLSAYLPTLPPAHSIAVFVGAMARGRDDFADAYVDEKISISEYSLSASVACGKVRVGWLCYLLLPSFLCYPCADAVCWCRCDLLLLPLGGTPNADLFLPTVLLRAGGAVGYRLGDPSSALVSVSCLYRRSSVVVCPPVIAFDSLSVRPAPLP
jgi:hypothetical protein